MKLPDAILIRPLTTPLRARISIPGSKSLTNRALILAALAGGLTRLPGALWSDDTERMVDGLRRLGFHIDVANDPGNVCNRLLTVRGHGGRILASQAAIDVGAAGTVARFLTALCALGGGTYRLHGTPRMHERPMKELFDAIRALGGRVEDSDGRLPAVVSGPIRPGRVSVSDADSSQFASALLLVSKAAGVVVDCPASAYTEMTRALLKAWETPSDIRDIEPDASSASYFIALQHLHPAPAATDALVIERWPKTSFQIDHRLAAFLPPPPRASRKRDLGDAVLTLAITAAALKRPFHLVDAANLRKQECDRISALAAELGKCGVPAHETPSELILAPASHFQKATIRTYQDHRLAMSFAVLGSVDVMGDGQPWLTLEDPACVRKTFPNFFETLESVARQSSEAAHRPYAPMTLTTDGRPVFA